MSNKSYVDLLYAQSHTSRGRVAKRTMMTPTTETTAERDRCAAIADGLAIAIKAGAGNANSEEFQKGCLAASEWISAEIKRAKS